MLRRLASTALMMLVCGCNMLLGTEKHDEFPANCGAESLTTARFSFSDDRNGHCYSLVQQAAGEEFGPDFSTAKDSCTVAGGMLACVSDEVEHELIARNVPTNAWLGMNSLATSNLQRFTCIDGEEFRLGDPAWAPGHPNSTEGGSCTILNDGLVLSRNCGNGGNSLRNWLCEFEPTSGD